MDFEKKALGSYLSAMSSHEFTTDYVISGSASMIDFYFPAKKVGIVCNGGGAIIFQDEQASRCVREWGITIRQFETADISKEGIKRITPELCNEYKIRENQESIHLTMRRFIEAVMAEIRAEEANFSRWTTEEDIDLPEESLELQTEVQQDTINSGENEDGQAISPTNHEDKEKENPQRGRRKHRRKRTG